MRIYFTLYIAGLFLASCSPVSNTNLKKTFAEKEKKFQDHIGFVLYDLKKKATIFSYNEDKYFTPASNTKIFTFYTALTLLKDSVPGIQFRLSGDSLIFWGTGDPSFLYGQSFTNDRVYSFLRTSGKQLYYYDNPMYASSLGPGWAWSDYRYSYSVERSAFPAYGNYFSVNRNDGGYLSVEPMYFKKHFWFADSTERPSIVRNIGSNQTEYYPGPLSQVVTSWDVPFKTSPFLTTDLLSDTLKKTVWLVNKTDTNGRQTLFSVPADSLYKTMMQESDNFIAEQLLLMCAYTLSDSLRPEVAIQFMKSNYLSDLPDNPVWVDGSGLSRYNLFTPRSVVKLWEKIYSVVERDRLFSLLAVGGKSGTLKNWYQNDPPYIYGKTGTLSNNHSLSGFLITKSGQTLIFCFMNNNFTALGNDVRKEMQNILKLIRDNY